MSDLTCARASGSSPDSDFPWPLSNQHAEPSASDSRVSFSSAYLLASLPAVPDSRSPAERALDELDFRAGVFRPGSWLDNDFVRSFMANGVSVPLSFSSKGNIPPALQLSGSEADYVRALLRDGIIEPGRAEFNHQHYFLRQGHKLRLIFDGRRLNSRCADPPRFAMTSHQDISRLANQYRWAAKFDFRAFFFNVPLAADFRRFFGFRCSLGDFRWTRMPFGWSWSPFFADQLAQSVVSYLRSIGVEARAYVDDVVIFANTRAECALQLQRSLDFCAAVGLRVKGSKTVLPSQRLSILGVVYDLVRKTSSLDVSFFHAVRAAVSTWSASQPRRCDFAAVVGSLVFANHAYPGSLSLLNPLFAFANQHANVPWRSRIDIGPILPAVFGILHDFAALPPCRLQVLESGGSARIFCDATPDQLGAVVDGQFHAAIIDTQTVFQAEAMGMAFALSLSRHRNVTVATDNQPLFNAVCKGRSPNPTANQLITNILQLRLAGAVIVPEWLRSEDNPADYPSRADVFDHSVDFHMFDSDLIDSLTFLD